MTCKEIAFRADDYCERDLPDSELSEIETHLESCHRCRKYIEQTQQLIEAMHRVRQSYSYSPKAKAQIMADFREYHAKRRRRRARMVAAAAVMGTAVLCWIVWMTITHSQKAADSLIANR